MCSGRIISVLSMSMLVLCVSCECDNIEQKEANSTARLIKELAKSVDGLPQKDKDILFVEVAAAGMGSSNGGNAALLRFLNGRELLCHVATTRLGHVGDPAANGRLEFVDNWGHALVVAVGGAKTVLVDLGGEASRRNPIEVPVPIVVGQGLLIWSVGPDGLNQSGAHDDLVSWRD